MVPILEPEVDINIPDKEAMEEMLNEAAGGISAVRHAMADMFNTIFCQKLDKNTDPSSPSHEMSQETKSIVIKYDKCTVFKKIILQNLILIII